MLNAVQKIVEENEFQLMKNEIAKAYNFESLFKIWNDSHKAEKEYKNGEKATFPQGIFESEEEFKGSFCWDGVTSLNGKTVQNTETQETEILLILKESNNGGKTTVFENKEFWFNETIEKPQTKDKGELKSYNTRCSYADRFKVLLKKLKMAETDKFGYMNINKRGGFGQTNYSRLKKYTAKYRNFILRQIELYNPKKIIFCGCYDCIVEILFGKDKNGNNIKRWNEKPVVVNLNSKEITLYYIYHPACSLSKFEDSLDVLNK